jgi:hypothetical protein
MSHPVYIPDGYNQSGYIAAMPQQHGAVRFVYRPVLYAHHRRILDRYNTEQVEEKRIAIVLGLLDLHLVSWDVTDPKTGAKVALEAKSIHHLHPRVTEFMFWIVMGSRASDPDQDAEPTATPGHGLDVIDAILKDQPIAAAGEAHDAGNCSPVSS